MLELQINSWRIARPYARLRKRNYLQQATLLGKLGTGT